MKRFEQYSDMIGRLYPDLCVLEEGTEDKEKHLSRTITFQVTDACNLACTYCLDGDTLICMADYSLKPIKDIEVGDKVLGFDETVISKEITNIYPTVVEQLFVHKDKLIEVGFETGEILKITKNHKVLTHRSGCNIPEYDFTEIGCLNIGDKVYRGMASGIIEKTKIKSITELDEEVDVYNIGTTSRTYFANGIAVHNCYQINKGVRAMKFETAKKLIDMLLTGDDKLAGYVDVKTSPAIIIEFIGGEPFLQIDLIEQICDYFVDKAIELEHPWADKFAISICSNGVLYFNEKVQHFLNKYRRKLSFSITIDGNKELHDACRVFPNGEPSYDLAVAGAMDWVKRGNYMGSKITIAPENLPYLYDAILHMVELGYDEINANVVYENVWKPEHAPQYYEQLIKIANYFIDNNLVEDYYLALFDSMFFKPMDENENDNWCFKAGTKILTPNGNRNIEDLKIGDEVITGKGNIEKVENVLTHYAEDTIKIETILAESIYTTSEHPFLAKRFIDGEIHDVEWVKASELKKFDLVAYYDMETGFHIWTPIKSVESTEPYEVYNLTVSNEHTFIANNIIVHNCGGVGLMLSCDPDGYLYPCIRYMESSLGNEREPLRIGNVDDGIAQCEEYKCNVDCLNCITRRSQSTDECFYCPIAQGCSWCFKAGTMITTPNGYVPIEDLKIGDEVIAGNGNIEKVEKVMTRNANDTIEIKATGMPSLYTTSEHPFWARNFHQSGAKLIYDEPVWTEASKLKKSDKIALFVRKFGDVDIDKNVAYLVGRYVGDGWKTVHVRGNCTSIGYGLCCSYNDCDKVEKYFNLAKVTYCKDKTKRTAQQYDIHTTNHNADSNNELFVSILANCGRYAHGKVVPNEVFTWNKESIEAFLRGYFDADAYYDKKRDTIKFSTVSEKLAFGISELLLMFGKKCNWSKKNGGAQIIEGRTVNTRTAYELSFLVREPIRKYYEFDEANGIMWVNIKSVQSAEPYEVYNLTVSNEHTFIANGAIVHNCSAYNFQVNGTPDSRCTFICQMHKARSLANVYYWNTWFRKQGKQERFVMHCPKEWALEIISEEEYNKLLELSSED